MKMPISFLKSVRNHEFFVTYTQITDMIITEGLTSKLVVPLLQRVVNHGTKLRELNSEPSKHPLSEQIEDQSMALRHIMRALKASIDALNQSNESENRTDRTVLKYWILTERADIVSWNKSRQMKAVQSLSDTIAWDERVGTALEVMGLRNLFDQGVIAYEAMKSMMMCRIDDWAEQKSKREGLRMDIIYDLRLLLRVIEGFANMESPVQEEYYNLALRLNKVLVDMRAIYLGRLSRVESDLDSEGMYMSGDDENYEWVAGKNDDIEEQKEGE